MTAPDVTLRRVAVSLPPVTTRPWEHALPGAEAATEYAATGNPSVDVAAYSDAIGTLYIHGDEVDRGQAVDRALAVLAVDAALTAAGHPREDA